jgi:ATP-binding cassette subfamily B protein
VSEAGHGSKAGSGGASILRLLRLYAWRYRWSYLAGFGFLWITNLLTVTIPGEIGHAVDALRASEPLGRYVAAIAAMGVAVIVVRTLSRVLIFNPGRYVEYSLRQDLFSRLLRLQPSFYALRQRGDIVSRASNDIGWVRTMVGYGGLQVVNVSVAVVLTGWKMVSLSPKLTLLTLVPVLAAMAVVQWSIHRLFLLARRNQEQLGEISEHVLGSLQGMATIQSFVAEEAFIDRFEARNREWLQIAMKLALIRSLALPLLVLGGGLALFSLIWVGGRMVLGGSLTVGQLTAFVALLTVFLPPLRSLGWMLSVIQRGRAALERIFELMDAPADRPEGEDALVLSAGRGPSLELRGLDFAYPDQPDEPVLTGVSVTIPAGSIVGLCGRTGSGKTTLLRLLARLYNPPRGTVLVDGHDLTSLDLDHWRRRLAVVPQRAFLFSDSVAFNIALDEPVSDREGEDSQDARPGEPEAIMDGVRAAASQAALGPDLEALPEGLMTTVGERGIMLSGGQRQRIALARGLLRQGDVLILDDVLSAVDHETEAQLVQTLTTLARRPQAPTVLIASHRLSALRQCDLILVLDRGRLVDTGTHAELAEREGLYRQIWEAQRQGATAMAERVAS